MYIYEHKNWPHFIWNDNELTNLLSEASFLQGTILGKMKALGFDFQQEAIQAR